MKTAFIIASLFVMGSLNVLVIEKEQLLSSGESIYLELAPRDPRSLMQGDYMDLNYQVLNQIRSADGRTENVNGYVVVSLDNRGLAQFSRLSPVRLDPAIKGQLAANERQIRYRIRSWRAYIGAESYFFQEGHAARYEAARYGELKVTPDGECLLVRLLDKDRQPL